MKDETRVLTWPTNALKLDRHDFEGVIDEADLEELREALSGR
jgi:hypothetical protein